MRRPDEPELFTPAPLPTAELSDAERLACLRLIRSENVGPVTFRELINHFGGAQKALDALPELSLRGGSGRPIHLCSIADAEKELAAASRAGCQSLFTIEPNYPPLLARIEAPPPMLYVKGRLDLLNKPAIAIVGSRQCSAAGLQMARHFAHDLAAAGFVIVSGLARGIDGAAHDASLSRGTIAVVAGGINWIYPPEHADLQNAIGRDGCLVSERPPGFKPRSQDFPRRNRIIAGLAFGVVVIEAAMRSGTLGTARHANDLGREVFALPGHPLDPRSAGTNGLLKQGATLVTEPGEVIETLRPMVDIDEPRMVYDAFPTASPACPSGELELPPRQPPEGAPQRSLPDRRDGAEAINAVLAALGPAPIGIDAITRASGLDAQGVQIALLELDLAGRIERQGQSLVALKTGR